MASRLAWLIDRVVDGFTMIAALACVAMMIHVTADVAGRTIFSRPFSGTIEIVSAYYMVLIAFLPLAWISRDRGHIIVELFTSRMRPHRKLALDVAVAFVTLFYLALFVWQAFVGAVEKTEIREAWEAAVGYVPVWQSRWALLIGVTLMLIYTAVLLVRDGATLRRRDAERIARRHEEPPA